MFIMSQKRFFKLCLFLTLTIVLCAQEAAAPTEKSISAQGAAVEATVDVAKSEAAPIVSDAAANQTETEEAKAPTPTEKLSVQTVQSSPPQAEPAASVPEVNAQPEPIPPPQPEPAQSAEAQSTPTNSDGLENLTQQQKKQLLHQQSIRAQLHLNQDLKLSELANMTVEQQMELERKFAEESRAAYERARKQMEQREAKEREQHERLMKEAKLTRSEEVKMRESRKLNDKVNSWGSNPPNDDYLFEIDPETDEDFMISLPVAQKIGFITSVYSNQDGVYVRAQTIDNQQPISIRILENNHNIIYQESFYYNDAHFFEGKAGSTYIIRFVNTNTHRLISLRVTTALESAQIQSKIKAEDLITHSYRTQQLLTTTQNKLSEVDEKQTLQSSNKRRLSDEIKNYYIYNCAEIAIFIVTVLVQIEMIRRLLGSSSIV